MSILTFQQKGLQSQFERFRAFMLLSPKKTRQRRAINRVLQGVLLKVSCRNYFLLGHECHLSTNCKFKFDNLYF